MVVRRDDAARPLSIDKTLDLRPEREAQRGANCAGREARTRAVSRGVTRSFGLARLARTAFVNVLWSEDERTALGLGTVLAPVRTHRQVPSSLTPDMRRRLKLIIQMLNFPDEAGKSVNSYVIIRIYKSMDFHVKL